MDYPRQLAVPGARPDVGAVGLHTDGGTVRRDSGKVDGKGASANAVATRGAERGLQTTGRGDGASIQRQTRNDLQHNGSNNAMNENIKYSETKKPRSERKVSLVGKILRGEVSQDELREIAPPATRYDDITKMSTYAHERVMTYVGELCTLYGVTEEQIIGRSRQAYVAEARHICWWVCRNRLRLTYVLLSRIFQRNHATIINGVGNVEGFIQGDTNYADYMQRLCTWLDTAAGAVGVEREPYETEQGHA